MNDEDRERFVVKVRTYFHTKDIRYIDSDCGFVEDVWIITHDGANGYAARSDIARLIFP